MSNYSLLRGRALRVTRTNGCGQPVLGPKSVVTSDGFITAALTSNTEAGEAIVVTNAAGRSCVNDTPTPRFVNYSVVLTFCGVNPELFNLLTGQPLVLDADDNPVGFRQNSKIDVDLVGFALELWAGIATAACGDDGLTEYGYILLPFLKGGVLGDFSVENAAINFTVTGAVTKDGSGWGVGPFDVVRDGSGNAGPLLEPIDANGDHLHLQRTTVPPPDVTDDSATALGVPATLITAGTPATLTPANSYAPENLAEIIADDPTKTPTTAWTTGQSVVLRDGSRAHWSGTAWVAGPA